MKNLFFIVALGVLILCAGCSEQSTAPPVTDDGSNGEYFIAALPEGVIDNLIATPEPETLVPNDPDDNSFSLSEDYYNIHCVKVMWGHMFNELPDSNYLDMSGRLMITPPGLVAVRRTIDFENDDYIVWRNDAEVIANRQYVEWVAHIAELDSDGIVFEIYSAKYYLATVIPQMIVEIYGRTFVFDFKLLDEMDTVLTLDVYNDLWIQSKKVEPGYCLKGRLGGTWVHKNFDQGFFYGKWYAVDNTLMGYLGGVFETHNDGRRIFYGGWCDIYGVFQGYLKGVWQYVNDVSPSVVPYPDGTFRGVFSDRYHIIRGRLQGEFGRFISDAANTCRYSQFRGTWSTCNATDNSLD
ncbi:MAG: hypothetical protein JXA92_10340 [candidate division Zixibacteria bacterium]|nr:hypothetical protein [candidate division Zixibacteria bacterium]